nr:unnamed protein product [Spirometra erinaceieuropaei]
MIDLFGLDWRLESRPSEHPNGRKWGGLKRGANGVYEGPKKAATQLETECHSALLSLFFCHLWQRRICIHKHRFKDCLALQSSKQLLSNQSYPGLLLDVGLRGQVTRVQLDDLCPSPLQLI